MYLSFTPTTRFNFSGTSYPEIRNRLQKRATGIARSMALTMINDLKKAVSTWRDPVPFYYKIEKKGDEVSVLVSTNNRIFYFINEGTDIRYATMTEDFIPKSSPGSLSAGMGAGGVAYVSRKVPRPGITPRRFMETVSLKHEARFLSRMAFTLSDEINNTFGGIFR